MCPKRILVFVKKSQDLHRVGPFPIDRNPEPSLQIPAEMWSGSLQKQIFLSPR